MKSIHLEFKGPFPGELFVKKDLVRDGKVIFRSSDALLRDRDSELPGVYVWGFKVNGKFIPYYVGKHHVSIASRIHDHLKDIIKINSTYVRLTKDYMEGPKPYYSDDNFPFETYSSGRNKLPGWVKDQNYEYFEKKIVYMNNKAFLEKKYNGISLIEKQRDYPINLIGDDKYDYLKDNIDKFFVGYVSYGSKEYYDLGKTAFFEFMETFIKYSLMGKTGSKSWSFEGMQNKKEKHGFQFILDNIDNYRDIFKIEPSDRFPGY